MAPTRPRAARSALEWAIRGGLAVAALAAGYFATVQSLARVVAHRDPVRAHALAPRDGQITALAAQARFAAQQGNTAVAKSANRAVKRLARRALRQDATAIPAIVTLGLQAQGRGDVAEARRWFAYSQALSRRDLQTQLWAIEDAVARNDVPGALSHYDIALRTSKSAPDLLYPVLADAIADPVIRIELARTLARRPAWGQGLITYLAESGDPRSASLLFMDARRAGVAIPEAAGAKVVNALLEEGDGVEAWRVYARLRPGVRADRSRDPRFAADLKTPSAFDWVLQGDGVIATSFQRRGSRGAERGGGLFDFAAPPSASGPLLRQVQVLPPGRYRLTGHSIGIAQPAASLPYWVLTCRNGSEIGRVVVPSSKTAQGRYTGTFVVPPGCPVQDLLLIARSSADMAGVSGQIDFVQLFPAG